MLKGEVFKNQIFENHIFALFINLFMNKADGVVRSYKNSMNVTYSGHNVTVNEGCCLVQGRLMEEDSSTTIDAGIETMFCKLVVEIDLDKINTTTFNQAYYNIVKSENGYPELTQQDIAGQNSGKYQFELARFSVSGGVITNFEDKRIYIEDLLKYGEIETLNNKMQIQEKLLNSSTIYNDLSQINSILTWSSSSASDIFQKMANNSIASLSFESSAKIASQLKLNNGGQLILFKGTPWRGMGLVNVYYNSICKIGYLNGANNLSWRDI